MSARLIVRVQKEGFDASAEALRLTQGCAGIGAVVTFTGLCRDEGGVLSALEIEHYPGMAEEEIHRVAFEAASHWPIEAALIVHRYGLIFPGELIVLVVTASEHRFEAFAAASFLMDYLKTEAPFWKKQHFRDSTGNWVEAKAKDDAAAQKWQGRETDIKMCYSFGDSSESPGQSNF